MRIVFLLLCLAACSAHAQTIYVVRHAEKQVVAADADQMMQRDPELSELGMQRAVRLAELLKAVPVSAIYSTPFRRTKATVAKVAEQSGLEVQIYSPRADSTRKLIENMRALNAGTILITGHSNTVDDIVNGITGESHIPGDLDESEYDNLFVLRKEAGKWIFERRKF